VSNKMAPNKRLKHARELCGWSRSYMAERIESDPKTVARWERGDTFPSPFFRHKLCELFSMDAEELGLIKDDHHNGDGQNSDQALLNLCSTPTAEREELQQLVVQSTRDKNWFVTHIPVYRQVLLLHRNHLNRLLVILSLIVFIGALTLPGKYVTIWVFNGAQLGRGMYIAAPVRIVPGGRWISPMKGQTINDIIHFAAHAYPTNPGDPPIDHVNFTIGWNGNWRIACIAYPTFNDDTFMCIASLRQLGAPGGPIQVSFDVYDKMGNVNKAPQGKHTIIYAPS